jgi:Carbohydrate esterase, sialic acid-specific acetylesterase
MEKHAAAMQAMFGAMANAYVARTQPDSDPSATSCRGISFHRRRLLLFRRLDMGCRVTPATWRWIAAGAAGDSTIGRPHEDPLRSDFLKFALRFVRLKDSAVSTLVFGNDVRRRTALFGGLAALAVSVFILGAILGAWAGVVRIWPVRYSLLLLEGPPKPFVNEPESPPLAVDSAGRLSKYAGKVEAPCPKQTQRTAVLLIAGQSNAANNAAQRHETRYPDRVLNFMSGRCYVARSPLLGSTGFAGEYWTLLADQLIDAGAFDRVILAPVAVGASNIAQWAKGGALNMSMIPLVQDLVTHYRVTHVLWHQGESDFALKTDPARYKEQFLSFVDSLRANAVDATVFVSTATLCLTGWSEANAIRTAQQELGFKPGVDTDKLLSAQDRYDDCHMADSGEVKTASAWAAILTQHP